MTHISRQYRLYLAEGQAESGAKAAMLDKNTIKTALLLVAITALFVGFGWLLGGVTGMVIAFAAAAVGNVLAWWNSGKLVRRMHNARELQRSEAPGLFEMTELLAARAEIPMPALYIMDSEQPNAFATGRNPENGAICLTTGIVNALNRDELAGVIAHEMAHIKNRDTLTMTYTATVAGAISMLSQYVFWFGGGRKDGPLGGLGLLVAAIVAPLAALIVRMFISRTREYEADRDGAYISGQPLALASALQKIAAMAERFRLRRARRHPAMSHVFIINPLTGGKGVDSWFATHPHTDNRVAELMKIAREMGQLPDQRGPRIGARTAPVRPATGSGPWG